MLFLRLLILVVLLRLPRVDHVRLYLQFLLPDAPIPLVPPLGALPPGALTLDVLIQPKHQLQPQLRRALAPIHVASVLLLPWQVGNQSNW